MPNYARLKNDMKKALFLAALFFVSFIASALLPFMEQRIYAAETNLIANPSLETVSNSQPAGWTASQWGSSNATLNLSSPGSDGQQSAYVAITNYQSGDAKWYFDPVTVTPGARYTFRNDYKATVASEIVVQYLDAAGTPSYQYLGTNEATTAWKSLSYTFTAPANAVRASVFHLIAANGELWTDTFSLIEAVQVPEAAGNLIPNAGVETPAGNAPYLWSSNSWGTLSASFAYATSGQSGSRSVYAKVSNYQSGDAKWYFNPVAVRANQRYVFSNYYKSTAESNTFLRYEKTDGTLQYVWLGGNPASSDWVQKTYNFTTPADVASVSVYHVLNANGELWTDTFALSEDTSTPDPTPASLILNPSVETIGSNGTTPANWSTNTWGNNTAAFALVNDGRTGTKALKTTVTAYGDGDAKWFFDPVRLTPGKDYVFSDYYKATVDSRVVVQITDTAGASSYLELPGAPASSGWSKYSASFTMPAGGVTATVFHLLSRAGSLTTDDFAIDPYQSVGFNRGLVTLSFDDGWEVNSKNALPIMQQYGFLSNQFYATTFIKNSTVANTRQLIQNFVNAGHEIGSHTITHSDLTTLSDSKLNTELVDSKTYLESYLGKPVTYFASPFGAYDTRVTDRIMQSYAVQRTVDTGYNTKDNFDVTKLKVQNILNTTTAADVDGWVKKAIAEKTWLILVYHRVAPNPGPYDTTVPLFRAQMQAIKDSGIAVRTITQSLNELRPQL